jgi:hypothetical protein
MELQQILTELSEIEKIIDPAKCNIISSYLNGFITEMEDDLHIQNLAVSNRWLEIRETQKSDSKTDRALEVDPLYQKREKLKLQISQLKRLRSDLKGRFEVLANIRRF